MSDTVLGLIWGAGAVLVVWWVWKLLTGTQSNQNGAPLALRSLITGQDGRFSLSKRQAGTWFFANLPRLRRDVRRARPLW